MQGVCAAGEAVRIRPWSGASRILLLEPNFSRGAWMCEAIAAGECTVLWVESESQAWSILDSDAIDLCLVAPDLGDRSGLEFCHAMKQNPATRDVPRFILSDFPLALPFQELQDYGVEGILNHHVSATDLRGRVEEVLFRLNIGGG